jgi:TonB family protein
MWSSLLWFHPAAHLLLSRIGLMREAVVDQATIATTGNRRAYAQALLAFAEPTSLSPLPVMHLIKPRHLSRRITLIAQEVRMSRLHSVVALAAALVLVSVAAGATATRFPIALGSVASAAQVYKPGDGVTLPRPIKDVKPQYTSAAMEQKIQGNVWMETVVRASGEPSETRITKSLDARYGLDEAAMQALSEWRFEPGRKDGKPVPVQVTIEMRFTLK